MKEKGLTVNSLESLFVNRVKSGPLLTAANKTLVYWEEILENTALPEGTVIQAWKSNTSMLARPSPETFRVPGLCGALS